MYCCAWTCTFAPHTWNLNEHTQRYTPHSSSSHAYTLTHTFTPEHLEPPHIAQQRACRTAPHPLHHTHATQTHIHKHIHIHTPLRQNTLLYGGVPVALPASLPEPTRAGNGGGGGRLMPLLLGCALRSCRPADLPLLWLWLCSVRCLLLLTPSWPPPRLLPSLLSLSLTSLASLPSLPSLRALLVCVCVRWVVCVCTQVFVHTFTCICVFLRRC